jgi:transcriptional regulator with XRE-family HTH domain
MLAIGKQLKRLRVERGLETRGKPYTQKEIALAVGIGESAVNNIENNKGEPSASTWAAIADFLGVPVDALRDDRAEGPNLEAQLIDVSVRAQSGDPAAMAAVKRFAEKLAAAEVARVNAGPSRQRRAKKKAT